MDHPPNSCVVEMVLLFLVILLPKKKKKNLSTFLQTTRVVSQMVMLDFVKWRSDSEYITYETPNLHIYLKYSTPHATAYYPMKFSKYTIVYNAH